MYTGIKELADSAVALQNKINMEAALREIGSLCNMMLDSVSLASAPIADAGVDLARVKTGDLTEASLEAATAEALASGEKLSFVPTHIAFQVGDGAKPKAKKATKK